MDERLEEIQELEGYGGLGGYAVYFKNKQQFEWLKQQAEKTWGAEHLLTNIYTHRNELAEKVQELETLLQGSKLMVDEALESIEKLHEENQRYKETLKFYADVNNHGDTIEDFEYEPPIYHDNGEKARRALRGEST